MFVAVEVMQVLDFVAVEATQVLDVYCSVGCTNTFEVIVTDLLLNSMLMNSKVSIHFCSFK